VKRFSVIFPAGLAALAVLVALVVLLLTIE